MAVVVYVRVGSRVARLSAFNWTGDDWIVSVAMTHAPGIIGDWVYRGPHWQPELEKAIEKAKHELGCDSLWEIMEYA